MSTDLHALSGAYAVDALDPDEAEAFRSHLADCPSCRAEVAEFQAAAARVGESQAAPPPTHLKGRIMATAVPHPAQVRHLDTLRSERSWHSRFPRLLAAAAMLLIAVAGIRIAWLSTDSTSDDQLAVGVSRIFDAQDARRSSVETAEGETIPVATSASLGRLALDTRGLPDSPTGQVYQLWTVAGAVPASAGLLEEPGTGVVLDLPAEGVAVAITVEPDGGSDRPTTDPITTLVPSDI